MPAKHRVKSYEENGYYHLFNRGVEKREVFRDAQDYSVYLSYLKTYLEPKDELSLQTVISSSNVPWGEKDKAIKLLRLNNFSDSISLMAFCLMPNHFHLLVKQTEAMTIDRFMNSLNTRYTMYLNKKYDRVGQLFQDVYKAVQLSATDQLLYLTRYIHRNPDYLLPQGQALRKYEYSSYPVYLGERNVSWVKTAEILSFFSKSEFNSYEAFVEGHESEEMSAILLNGLEIDS